MPVLIDGHNLIGRLPTLALDDPDDEGKLVRLLKSYRSRTGQAITVVFDAGTTSALSGTHREGGVEVVFAPPGSSADAVITRRVEKSRDPGAWLVVTSDSELANLVARRGARIMSAEALAARLLRLREAPADEEDMPLSPEEVKAWLLLFEGQDSKDVMGQAD